MLDVRRMRVLREVAQRGSFSAAAEALSFTQSAVSQQIAALEREAGTTLVERSVRGIRLTDAGPEASLPKLRGGELEIALSFAADGVPAPGEDAIERVHLLDDPLYLAL